MKKAPSHGLRSLNRKNTRLSHHIHQFIRYLIVGMVMLVISLLVIGLCMKFLGIHYLTACGITFILESFIAFFINKHWTFGSSTSFRKGYFRFLVIAFYSTVVILLITYGLTSYFALQYVWARTLSTVIMGIFGYFLDMRIAFRML